MPKKIDPALRERAVRLVLLDYPAYPGVGIKVRPVGVLKMSDEAGSGDKVDAWGSAMDAETLIVEAQERLAAQGH